VPPVTATIITFNEAAHVGAAIESVRWADEILVVDSGSTDDTCAIARENGARVESRAWSGWSDQKNHAAAVASHDWILSLDADERVSPDLTRELRAVLSAEPHARGYRMPRVTYYLGRWIRTTDFYPDYQLRLYDRRAARWRDMLVHESVTVDGPVLTLAHELQHFSFTGLADHVARTNRYSTLAAREMHQQGRRAALFHLLLHPPAAFLRNYVLRRGFQDGTAGLIISAMQAGGVFLKYAKLWELERSGGTGGTGGS
jgi:glycosyltransferase involved in cell wall biosynthesis